MKPLPSTTIHLWTKLLAVVAAAFSIWQCLDFGPLPEATRLRDDAYYYFAWAASMASGTGPCVTAEVPTSGVHYAWGLMLTGLVHAFDKESLPLLAQILGLILHGVTAAVVARVGGALPGLLLLGNPLLLREAHNGQETALAALALTLVICSWRRWGWFLLAAVLLVFSRSDLAFVVVTIAFVRGGWRSWLVPLVAIGSLLATHFWVTGDIRPDSEEPMRWLMGRWLEWAGQAVFRDPVRADFWYLRPVLLGGPFALAGIVIGGALCFVVLQGLPALLRVGFVAGTAVGILMGASDYGVPLVAAALLVFHPLRLASDSDQLPLAATWLGLLVMVIVHECIRHYPRDYYFAPMGIAGVLAFARVIDWMPKLTLVLTLLAVAEQVRNARSPGERLAGQQELAMAGRHLHELVGSSPIASFNSGILTWYHRAAVVNLDGVVNRAALEALQRSELDAYLDQRQIRYLIDTPAAFEMEFRSTGPHTCGRYFDQGRVPDLQLLAVIDAPHLDSAQGPGAKVLHLYGRRWREPPLAERVAAKDLGRAPGGGRYLLWPAKEASELRMAPLAGAVALGVPPLVKTEPGVVYLLHVKPQGQGRFGLFGPSSAEPLLTFDG